MRSRVSLKSQPSCLLRSHDNFRVVTLHEARLERKLVCGQTHGFLRHLRRYALHLKEHLAGTDNRDPVIGSALALAHTGFGRLLGDRLVGEKTQPDLAATLDEAGHRHTAGFNLPVGDVTALHDLQSVIAERKLASAPRLAAHEAALLLAKLDLLWHQHNQTLKTASSY